MKLHLKIVLVLLAMVLASCTGAPPEVSVPPDLDQQLLTLGVEPYAYPSPQNQAEVETTPTPPAAPPDCPAPYAVVESSRPEYDLYLYLGVGEHAGYVAEKIVYPNLTGEALDEIVLVVESNWQPGVFSMSDFHVVGLQSNDYELDAGVLQVPLDDPLSENCSVELQIEYHLEIPEQAGIFGYTEDQLVLTNWYPFIPPYDPLSGWQVNNPGSFGEHLVYPTANFSVTLDLADPAENVFVAAAALPEKEGNRYRYHMQGVRTFSLAVLNDYSVRRKSLDGIDIEVYSKRATIAEVEAALDTAAAALQVFERIFGPYPFESLTIAQIEMYDGMEYDGIFFLSEEVFGTYNWGEGNMLTFLTVHEISHNWWFSQVGNDQAREPWLDEALATYCEVLFYELVYPERVDWWWELRVEEYEPEGDVDASIYTYSDYESYRQAVYLQGVKFLQALREQMGDEAFFAFLRMYLEEGRYRVMTAADFFGLLEGEFSVEVDDLRAEYFGAE